MPRYRSVGTLTGTIHPDNVAIAQDYLSNDDMSQYLDKPLKKAIRAIEWMLDDDGHNYTVEIVSKRKLTKAERKELGGWISGQNSDGLGEGFEQQEFAETSEVAYDDEEDMDGYETNMISFDWKTNKSKVRRVRS